MMRLKIMHDRLKTGNNLKAPSKQDLADLDASDDIEGSNANSRTSYAKKLRKEARESRNPEFKKETI